MAGKIDNTKSSIKERDRQSVMLQIPPYLKKHLRALHKTDKPLFISVVKCHTVVKMTPRNLDLYYSYLIRKFSIRMSKATTLVKTVQSLSIIDHALLTEYKHSGRRNVKPSRNFASWASSFETAMMNIHCLIQELEILKVKLQPNTGDFYKGVSCLILPKKDWSDYQKSTIGLWVK